MIDLFVAVFAVLVVAGVVVLAIVKKKQGKIIVCDCSSCDNPYCRKKQEQEK